MSSSPSADAPAASGRRERTRQARHRRYLDTAMQVVAADGVHALTMQRLADELDCAVGTVYTYFPSKGALVAELQREAIERLHASYRQVRTRSDDAIDGWDQADATLARLVVFGRFWIATVDSFPQEAAFLHGLVSEPRPVVSPEDAERAVPAAMAILRDAQDCVEAAVSAGAIGPGPAEDRVIRWAAALTGALQISNLAELDPETFDGRRLARQVLDDLLLGWGAPAGSLARAEAHADGLAADGSLAPG